MDKNKLRSELQIRIDRANPLYDEFVEVQGQIELLNADSDNNDDELVSFENAYFDLLGSMQALCIELNSEQNSSGNASVRSGSNDGHNNSNGNSNNNVQALVKLPAIKLPVFNGHYDSWLEFKDCFLALVHNNDALSDIQRFYYLRSSLADEAQQIIKSIEVSSSNYSIAWQMLEERYENKKLIIHNHLRAIFEHPIITKESHFDLRNLFDSVTKHLRSLNSLGLQTDSWDSIIIYIISCKFDSVTRRDWESFKYTQELPSLKDLNKFLKEKCELLEKLEITSGMNPSVQKGKFRTTQTRSFASVDQNQLKCYYCQNEHPIYRCEAFLRLNVTNRILAVKRLKLCLNCLKDSHPTWKCKLKKCIKCHKLHNSLLHLNSNINTNNSHQLAAYSHQPDENVVQTSDFMAATAGPGQKVHDVPSSVTMTNHTSNENNICEILLSTVLVHVVYGNKQVLCRALLDSGSQSNFITENVCNILNLKCKSIDHSVKGVGETLSKIEKITKVKINSCNGPFSMEINCLVIPKITEKIPTKSFNKISLNIPTDVTLADPSFCVSETIDLLLGSHIFWSILTTGRKGLGPNMPILQNTEFGWVIAGNLYLNHPKTNDNISLSCLNINNEFESISDKIEKFWKLEEVNLNKSILSKEDMYCQNYFKEHLKKDVSGKYIVKIPFKDSVNELGDSKTMALHRFDLLERKLNKSPELKIQYVDFMTEYLKLGHMTEIHLSDEDGYFLPHHAIIKESSLTTKCRVVFDGSAKSSSGLSLNDVQYTGPSLQQDIFLILIRFRMFKYVLSGDISKMYRQILIDKSHRKFQKIFWRTNPADELRCYELNTVTYGTASAPYLAVRTLLQVAEDNESNDHKIAEIIRRDFYMDDLLTSSNSKFEIIAIQKNISDILASSGFEMRKWLSNDADVLKDFKLNNELDAAVLPIGEQNKTLGLYWDAKNDVLKYKINVDNNIHPSQWSKRSILSMICQIYDPLGLLGPIIITAKLIMQDLWKRKIEWDKTLPSDITENWLKFYNNIYKLNTLQISRHSAISEYVTIELHGFSDASSKAYGCCIFIRCLTSSGKYISQLLCAKSRVAPLKLISLPRLELCGAVLLANLFKKVTDSLNVQFNGLYCWTDSTICLCWIKEDASRWKQFVANRVQEIQNLTDVETWYHVQSEHNPADLISRGIPVEDLMESKLWRSGPEWFGEDMSKWKIQGYEILHNVPEEKTITCIAVNNKEFFINELLNRFSSIKTFLKVLCYILRFANNCKNKPLNRKFDSIDPIEVEQALNLVLKHAQLECFANEYNSLKNKREISNKSKILSLNPFLHDDLLRVGGRLKNCNIPFNVKHQIILPNQHILTKRILQYEHERLLHCGVQQLIFSIRQKYWLISARNSCKQIIHSCISCYKAKPKAQHYIMGNLPKNRVNSFAVFENVGTDYGGPFLIKDRKTRGAKLTKAYICLFICMCTKAVHIELVSELSTDAFLAACKRFINRRGRPHNIYSDNGTNYLGANNELEKLYSFLKNSSDYISDNLLTNKIKWHFIPANSPTFGGLWEAGIKSIKSHLKRVSGNSSLTFEEFSTLLVQIEGVLNSRPLCAMSSDPDDNTALTPAHFLIGRTITTLPEFDLLTIPENRLDKWQRIQSMMQHLWNRWREEYLNELQVRQKWRTNGPQLIKIGSLVLLKDDKTPPLQWPLGRVTACHPGQDGVTRVVTVKVRGNTVKRSINRVCMLPIEQ